MGDAAAQPAVSARHLVGRDSERARVDAFSDALRTGARALVIRGEAGIGKSALWRDGVERCRLAGQTVLVARPTAEESLLATAGLVDLFEDVDVASEALLDVHGPLERGRIVLNAIRRLAQDSPVVLAIDDLQWLDSVSARTLRYALRRFDDEPVGILATYRRSEEADLLSAAELLPSDRFEWIDLGPLDVDALRRVVADVVESISRPTLARIHAVSGGNPLFAIELARMPRTEGRVVLPESLQAAIAATVERAPMELQPVLDLVAVLGATSVAELTAQLGDEVPELLETARQQRLLVVEDDLGVRFEHPLVSSVVYARMSPITRRSQHRRAAQSAADPDVRARHLALSTDEPDPEVASLLEHAASRAGKKGAPDVAAEFAGRSVALTPESDEDALRRRSLARIEYLGAAGEVHRALLLADNLVDALMPGHARVEALMLRADLEDDDRATAEALLLGALDEAGDDRLLRGRVLHRLAQLRRLRIGDVRGAIDGAREALALAEQVGDPSLEASAAAYVGHLETLAGTPRPDLMERAVRLEEQGASAPLAVGPRLLAAKQRLWAGSLDDARWLLDRVRTDLVRSGHEMKRAQLGYDLTLLECAAGDIEAAEGLVRAALEAALDAENTYTERELLYPLALVQALRGHADEARATAARLEDEARRHGLRPLVVRAHCVLGKLALAEGDASEAATLLSTAADTLEEMGFAHPGAFPILPDAIEACARADDAARADRLLARLEREGDAVASEWARAGALRGRGIVLATTGDPEAAAATLDEAEAAFARLGFRLDAARAQLARGSALLRAGRRSLAAEVLADARERFAMAGASLWETRAAEELDRAAPGRAAGELTPAERRVSALVARGLKNREIAGRLYMGVATVEAHLTRIYRKLGIRSRSELVRLVMDGSVSVAEDDARTT